MTDQLTLEDEPRGRAYVWASWITKLLAGESRCWYAVWYKATHKYLKRPDAPDRADFFAEYNRTHDRLVNDRAAELKRTRTAETKPKRPRGRTNSPHRSQRTPSRKSKSK